MPHDRLNQEIKEGDELLLRVKVLSVSTNETACNVNVQAIIPPGIDESYAPNFTCNTRLFEKRS